MASPTTVDTVETVQTRNEIRIYPQNTVSRACSSPLSLLDATTANFGLTSAVWLLERPVLSLDSPSLATLLKASLSQTLDAYPQWCGYLKTILTTNANDLAPEVASFPRHAKRYGRVYVHYGTETDPGVDFIEATSTVTVDDLYTAASAERRPIWNRKSDEETLGQFVPPTNLVHALEPNEKGTNGLNRPIMAVQYTLLACGGLVLAVKIAHPLADISALTHFVRDWASISRAMIMTESLPVVTPVFDTSRLDGCAEGDINANSSDLVTMQRALDLPLHRYDWWAPPGKPPAAFPPDLPPAGKSMPWSEWDTTTPVDQYTVHFTKAQIEHLYQSAKAESPTPTAWISKHDALLAHIWTCVVRARNLAEDQGPVHCDLVLGTRPALGLGNSFIGSPVIMLNIEMTASEVASPDAQSTIARRIRDTVATINDRESLAAHLHTVAYEASPQRIWQGFLGQRHIMVTSWIRAGLYDVDFGLGARIRYADGVVPCVDGCVLIVDSPPVESGTVARGWADNGVDVTLPLLCGDMKRLLRDPLLFPEV